MALVPRPERARGRRDRADLTPRAGVVAPRRVGEVAQLEVDVPLLEQFMRDDGTIIQPYWRSLYRHTKDNVVNGEMHPTFEIHVHDIGFAA